jgi:16S rRNA (cytidine1402-2'-O)-methyltransferase
MGSDWQVLAGEAPWRLATPALYVVATPLGNRYDLSIRALAVLSGVAGIAAEDTRVTGRLLASWGINTPLLPVHDHNERAAAELLCARLAAGEHWALVSDAGTPAVSDPGVKVVAQVRERGFPVVAIPGPSAVTAAISISGFGEEGFAFRGFLPAKAAQRRAAIRDATAGDLTTVWFEAPHRIVETLRDLADILGGDHPLFLAREMTKRFEESVRGTVSRVEEWLSARHERQQGEFVLVVPPRETLHQREEAAHAWCARFLAAGVAPSEAVRWAAELFRVSKNQLYDWVIAQRRDPQGE